MLTNMQKEVTYSFSATELHNLVMEALKNKGIKFDRFTINIGADPNDDGESRHPSYIVSGLTVHYKEPVE
jgi:hypothetical protein